MISKNFKTNIKSYLTIDIGNSFIKMGLFNENKELIDFSMFPSKKIDLDKIISKLETYKMKNIVSVIMGCVVKSYWEKLNLVLKNVLSIEAYRINEKTKFSFDSSGFIAKGIGDDLLALSEYAVRKNENSIAFSFGTSNVGLFIVDKKLIGVSISAGLESSYNSLISKASLLKKTKIDRASLLSYGQDTSGALESGYFHHRNGFLLSFVNSIKAKYDDKNFYIVASGNAATSFNNNHFVEINKYAILEGYLNILTINIK
ncbi:type III pantothenate kinase [Mycoplasma crocodyli]|uniref:Type III pantothenate kinase n=1 Tax=Mycoplasma crocodyli (strain ATCC 51981 / MP145) TaxID=512564 RepID=D5E4L7_MYCCM|nr:type III pantothenate kinase [Mycoplasma crocodyli]ADE19736.1 pantothenate kinase, type III [Mycoplasma crocodyli MP145]